MSSFIAIDICKINKYKCAKMTHSGGITIKTLGLWVWYVYDMCRVIYFFIICFFFICVFHKLALYYITYKRKTYLQLWCFNEDVHI